MNGYSIGVIPRSWGFGLWRKKLKSVFAFGPFRFVIHRGLGEWKQPKEPIAPTEPRFTPLGLRLDGA